jgi:hypothetical protein
MQARIATRQLFPAAIPIRVNFDRDLEVDRKSPENFHIAFRIPKPSAFKMISVPGGIATKLLFARQQMKRQVKQEEI